MRRKRRKIILLIEDDEPLIDVYTIAFTKVDHFKLEVIRYGFEALDWIKKVKAGKAKKPDLVLLDLILPDMNGLDILEEIRKTEGIKDLPVFILTNYSNRELEKLGRQLGPEKYLQKTEYPPTRLISLIKKMFKEKEK